ncbi:hypothetical protein JCM19992_16120 [Thermostilla marina]
MTTITPADPAKLFPPELFKRVPAVPVFAEHETTLSDGRPARYDRAALEAIAETCNRRIAETGDYVALVIGHAPPWEERPVIGFAGPFRVVDRDGRAVLVADFHLYKEHADALKKYPRRSPELHVPRDGRPFDPSRVVLDPICLLGASTPRLPTGLTHLYSARAGDGVIVDRYAAVYPSAADTYIPTPASAPRGPDRIEPTRDRDIYTQPDEEPKMLTPEDIKALLAALEELPWVKWAKTQAEKAAAEGDDEPQDTTAAPDGEPDQYSDDRPPEPPQPPAEDDKHAAPPTPDAKPDQPEPERYSRRLGELAREIYTLRGELEKERGRRVDTERRARLEELSRRYQLDVDEELERCRYSRMADDEFARHLELIETRYRPIPADTFLPTTVAESDAGDHPGSAKERYQRHRDAELRRRAVEIGKRLAARGQYKPFDEILAELHDQQ